jgi:hypothetical protein
MTLQELLLKLSHNKNIAVECFCSDGKIKITIKEWYSFNILLEKEISLIGKIENSEFKRFF